MFKDCQIPPVAKKNSSVGASYGPGSTYFWWIQSVIRYILDRNDTAKLHSCPIENLSLWGAWVTRLSVRLQLGSWSHGLWVRAPRRALCLTAQSPEPASDSVSPSLSAPRLLALCLSLKNNKH